MKKVKQRKFRSEVIGLISAVLGVIVMVLSSSINSSSDIEKAVSVGIMLILVPFIIFQFAFFSGRSGLLIEKSDLKTLWLWVFVSIFILVDSALFSTINVLLGIIPRFKEWVDILTWDYFSTAWGYILIIFAIISGAALVDKFHTS